MNDYGPTRACTLRLLLATFAGQVGRQQTAVITSLIEENHVLREKLETDKKAFVSQTTNAAD